MRRPVRGWTAGSERSVFRCRDILVIYAPLADTKKRHLRLCEGNNVKGWNVIWNIIFNSLPVLHWWPYTIFTVCVELRSSDTLWALAKVCPEDCGRWPTLPDTLYHSGPHTFKWTRFVISSTHRNIIEVSCVEITHAINTVCVMRRCSMCFLHSSDGTTSGRIMIPWIK